MSRIVKGIALALVFVLAGIGTFWGLGQVLHFETGLPSFFSSGQPFYH